MTDNEKQKITELLVDVVQPGSSWIVRGIANDVLVESYDVGNANTARNFSSELITKLEALNQRLSDSGGMVPLFMVLGTVLACVGIHLDWFTSLLGEQVKYIQSIWFYLVVVVAAFFISGRISEWFERRVYQRHRNVLIRQIKEDGLTLSDVYVRIRDDEDEELYYLCRWLRQDSSILEGDEMRPFDHLA